MKNYFHVRKIPLSIEVVSIVFISLGYFIYTAFQWLILEDSGSVQITYQNSDLHHLILYELISLTIVGAILKWQGRSLKNYGISISVEKVTMGLALFVTTYIVYLVLYTLFGDFVFSLGKLIPGSASSRGEISFYVNVSILHLSLFSIINSIFEEFILVGYIVTSIRKKMGLATCLILSVGFRLSFHVYQGPIILLTILPMGIIFTLYFWHKRSIIPLIIGHAIMDFLSFSILMAQSK